MSGRKLGRGLKFLLSEEAGEVTAPKLEGQAPTQGPGRGGGVQSLPLDRVHPNPFQPRSHWDEGDLDRLAASIRKSGVLQPVLVRPKGDGYELIAGERRLRAARRAGLESIPAIVRQADDEEVRVLALIENIQRTDLNPMEKARSFKALLERSGWTQQQVAEEVGLQRASVANYLRLLELPAEIQSQVERGRLSMGHARALLSAPPGRRPALAKQILAEGLSVRAAERLASAATKPSREAKEETPPSDRPPWIADMEEQLLRVLGCRVQIRYRRGRGRITLEVGGREQFQRIYELLMDLDRRPSEEELVREKMRRNREGGNPNAAKRETGA